MNVRLTVASEFEADPLLSLEFAEADAPNQRAPNYLPTPDEIRAWCAEIQAGWSDHERCIRSGSPAHELDVEAGAPYARAAAIISPVN